MITFYFSCIFIVTMRFGFHNKLNYKKNVVGNNIREKFCLKFPLFNYELKLVLLCNHIRIELKIWCSQIELEKLSFFAFF